MTDRLQCLLEQLCRVLDVRQVGDNPLWVLHGACEDVNFCESKRERIRV